MTSFQGFDAESHEGKPTGNETKANTVSDDIILVAFYIYLYLYIEIEI